MIRTILLGLMIAIGRLYGRPWLRIPLTAYVEFLRGTPVMLQLYFIFFFLPEVGVQVPAFWTGVLGLARVTFPGPIILLH